MERSISIGRINKGTIEWKKINSKHVLLFPPDVKFLLDSGFSVKVFQGKDSVRIEGKK